MGRLTDAIRDKVSDIKDRVMGRTSSSEHGYSMYGRGRYAGYPAYTGSFAVSMPVPMMPQTVSAPAYVAAPSYTHTPTPAPAHAHVQPSAYGYGYGSALTYASPASPGYGYGYGYGYDYGAAYGYGSTYGMSYPRGGYMQQPYRPLALTYPEHESGYGLGRDAPRVESASTGASASVRHREERVHREDRMGNHEDRVVHEDRMDAAEHSAYSQATLGGYPRAYPSYSPHSPYRTQPAYPRPAVRTDAEVARAATVHRDEMVHRDDRFGNHEDRRIHEDREAASVQRSQSEYRPGWRFNPYTGAAYPSAGVYRANQEAAGGSLAHRTEDTHRTDAYGNHMDTRSHVDTGAGYDVRSAYGFAGPRMM